jgi:hypothetical protein
MSDFDIGNFPAGSQLIDDPRGRQMEMRPELLRRGVIAARGLLKFALRDGWCAVHFRVEAHLRDSTKRPELWCYRLPPRGSTFDLDGPKSAPHAVVQPHRPVNLLKPRSFEFRTEARIV